MTLTGDRTRSTAFPLTGQSASDAAEALFKEARLRRSRRRRAIGAVVIGLSVAIALAVGALMRVDDGPAVHLGARPASPSGGLAVQAMPSRLVVWGQTGRTMSIQVLSSRSGHVVRTLASDVGLFDSTPQPAAAPDGTVYYDEAIGATQQGPGAHPPVEQIMSVPVTGGPSTFVADGHDPSVSPNGRYLAYVTWTQLTSGPEAVVVRNRSTGAVETWRYSTDVPGINSISWSPDSRSLMVWTETLVGVAPRSSWHLSLGRLWLSVPKRSLEDLPQVQLPRCPFPTKWAGPGATRQMAWAGFLNAQEGIGICRHVGRTLADDRTQAVLVNLERGAVVRKLPALPGLISVAPNSGFDADASGHYLTFIGEGLGAGGLYRWTIDTPSGERANRPVFIKNNVGSADWVSSNGGG